MNPKLQDMINDEKVVVLPGIYDAIGARLAEKAGFEAVFQTGYGTSATVLGMPDYGFIGATETVDHARRMCAAVSISIIVDSDTGYGNALSVWKLVKELEAAGAAGIFLEDQKWPKRCGHMKGKEVISQEEYTEKLGAALDARSSKDFFVVARTDARATDGIDEAIERGKQNAKTGASAVFVEALKSVPEMEKVGSQINAPLVANMIEGGTTPICTVSQFQKMGFNIVLYPLSVLFATTAAASGILRELREKGTTTGYQAEMSNFDQFNELMNLAKFADMEKKYTNKDSR